MLHDDDSTDKEDRDAEERGGTPPPTEDRTFSRHSRVLGATNVDVGILPLMRETPRSDPNAIPQFAERCRRYVGPYHAFLTPLTASLPHHLHFTSHALR